MEQSYEEEIKLLQQEIETYEAEQEKYIRSISIEHGEVLQSVLKTICSQTERGNGVLKKDISKLITEICNMETDLRRQTEISELNISECSVKTLEKGERKTLQHYRLSGQCRFLSFQVEFALMEIQDTDTFLRKVTDLNIIVDGAEFKDFGVFVSRAEETRSLFLFFRTLKLFSERCAERARTFQYFKEKYPDAVCLPEGCRSEVMMIQNPSLTGYTLNIYWRISVTKDGVVKPRIELLMKMPDQAQQMDPQNVMETAPESFQSLLMIFGVEASIECLIKTMCI